MKRALSVVALTIVGLIPVWRYDASTGTNSTTEVAAPAPAPSSSPNSPPDAPSSSNSPSAVQFFPGTTVNTEKGEVQVEVTFDGDQISSVRMLKQPNHPQTTDAVPKLIEATLDAQSADIDTVSGATITSDGYARSLQAAIDANGA